MSRFRFIDTPLTGLRRVERTRLEDERGFLSRLFCADEFSAASAGMAIAQINQTLTRRRGSIRGMHFQHPPHAEAKLVSCISGTVFDVAVDLRAGSPTFLHWHGEILSSENRNTLFIPQGFAHGFQTLSDNCELLYMHSAAYHPAAEAALNALDPRLAIKWPEAIADMSERDRNHPLLTASFAGITL